MHETEVVEAFDLANYAGTIGLYGLNRLDLIVDASHQTAYLRPRWQPGPPYPGLRYTAPDGVAAAEKDAAGPTRWTVEGRLRLRDDELMVVAARSLRAAGDLPGARAALDRALALDPDNPQFHLARGEIEGKQGDLTAALADYTRAVALDLSYADAYNNRGATRLTARDPEGAIADFDRAIALNPKTAKAWNNRGFTRFFLGDFAGAEADYDHAIALDPSIAAAFLNRAKARQILGHQSEALADADREVALDPNPPEAVWIERELLRLRLGLGPSDFRRIVAGWKDGWSKTLGRFVTGQIGESDLVAELGHPDAKPWATRSGEAYFAMGTMRSVAGDRAGAKECWQKVLASAAPLSDEYRFATAELAR